jgi:regulator of replication initiation timing
MNCKHCKEPIDFNPDEPYWVDTKTWFHANAVDGAPDAGKNRNGTYCRDGENEAEPNWEAENATLRAELERLTSDQKVLQALIEDYQKAVDGSGRHHLIAPENVKARFDEVTAENATLRAELERLRELLEESWTTLCDVCEFHGDPEYHLDVQATRELMKRIDAAKGTK